MRHQLLGRQDYPYEAVMPAVAQQNTELEALSKARDALSPKR